MDAIIEDITKDVSVYFLLGTVARDTVKHDDYEISEVKKDGLVFSHKPFFRAEKKNDLPIGYDELVHAFSKGKFFIHGFSEIIEGGYKHDFEKLKRAIKDTRYRIEKEEQRVLAEKLSSDKTELQLAKEAAEKATAEALAAKKLAEETTESLLQKRKTKNRVKAAAIEEEAIRKRIALEEKEALDNRIKISTSKGKAQLQRLRLIARTNA